MYVYVLVEGFNGSKMHSSPLSHAFQTVFRVQQDRKRIGNPKALFDEIVPLIKTGQEWERLNSSNTLNKGIAHKTQTDRAGKTYRVIFCCC